MKCLMPVCAALLVGCHFSAPHEYEVVYSDEIDWAGMEEAERNFNEWNRRELLKFMSLESMFPEERLRALAAAAGRGDLKKVEKLVAHGVDVNARGYRKGTSLFWSLRKGSLSGFKKLLELGADPNTLLPGTSVMHLAARRRNTGFLRAALDHGGDPNLLASEDGEPPIFETVGLVTGWLGDDRESARLMLIEAGADINARSKPGEVPSEFHNTSPHPGPLGTLAAGRTLLMVATALRRYDLVYELLTRGADYRPKDADGSDLAHRVAAFPIGSQQERNKKRVVKWLSERGVDVSQRCEPWMKSSICMSARGEQSPSSECKQPSGVMRSFWRAFVAHNQGRWIPRDQCPAQSGVVHVKPRGGPPGNADRE